MLKFCMDALSNQTRPTSQLASYLSASLPEMRWDQAPNPYLNNFKSDLDGMKSKVSPLNWFNLTSYLAHLTS